MYEKLEKILSRRAELVQEAKKILDKADEEGRSLTADERNRYDAILEQIEALNGDMDRIDRLGRHFNELRDMRIGDRDLGDPPGKKEDRLYAYTPEGNEVRLYRNNERFEPETNLPDGIQESELSFGRFLRAVYTGDWSHAQAEKRVMSSTTGAEGGVLAPFVIGKNIIEAARVKARVIRAGAVTFKMEAPQVTFARIDGYPSMTWTEEGEEIEEGDLTFKPLHFKAAKLASIVRAPEELMMDATNLEQLLREVLSSQMAISLDRSALYGAGLHEPLGLLTSEDIRSTTVSSAPAADAVLGHLIDAEFELLDQNLDPSEISMLYNSTFGKTFAKATDAASHYLGGSNTPVDFAQVKKFMTNQIDDDDTATATPVLFGRFSDLMIGVRMDVRIDLSKEEGDSFKKDLVAIRVIWRGDAMPVIPAHFHKLLVATS